MQGAFSSLASLITMHISNLEQGIEPKEQNKREGEQSGDQAVHGAYTCAALELIIQHGSPFSEPRTTSNSVPSTPGALSLTSGATIILGSGKSVPNISQPYLCSQENHHHHFSIAVQHM